MKVLFVVKELRMEPLGIMHLSAALKAAGHKVDLACLDEVDDRRNLLNLHDLSKNDFLAFSVCSGSEEFYLNQALNLLEFVGKVRTIFGGPAVTFNPEAFRSCACDYTVRGEGEKAIVDIVESRPHEDLELVDLNSIPLADRMIVYKYRALELSPIKNIITRRGCKYACSYCFNREWNRLHKDQLPKGVIRYRDVRSVVDEGFYLKFSWPVKLINFVDDNFASSVEWLEEFVRGWSTRVKLPFFCSVRPEDASDEVMEMISRAGGVIANMAIECANDVNRREVLTRTGTKEAVERAIQSAKKFGVRTRLQNIIGLPVEDPVRDGLETLDFNLKVRPTSSWCAILQPYKGTRVYEIARERGAVEENHPVDVGFFNESCLKIKRKREVERLHKIWPLVTRVSILRRIVPFLIKLPIPFSVWKWVFNHTKKYFAEKELWRVFGK